MFICLQSLVKVKVTEIVYSVNVYLFTIPGKGEGDRNCVQCKCLFVYNPWKMRERQKLCTVLMFICLQSLNNERDTEIVYSVNVYLFTIPGK